MSLGSNGISAVGSEEDQANTDNNIDDRTENLSQDSEASSISFHSLQENIENLNLDDTEFSKPDFMNKEDYIDPKWFDTNENLNVDHKEEINEHEKSEDPYLIDEEYLKDLEITLTEEQKKEKQENAKDIKNNANQKFRTNVYDEAALLYTEALRICPLSAEKDRAVLYANRAAARSKLGDEQVKEAIKDCDKAIEYDPCYLKAIIRRANLHEQVENLDEALRDFKRVLELDPSNNEAKHAVMVLPQKINDKNERLKEEMMGKLKDLGNMILKPFGLSTSNFEMKQDPNTGGYNINFNQSPR